jgi:hypothetical protein
MKKIYTLLILTSCFFHLSAATYTSINNGQWNNPLSWNPTGIPDVGDDVIIASGHTITVSSSHITNSLTVNQGGTLTMQINRQLTIFGDLTVNGYFTMNDGNISFPTPGAKFTIGPAGSFTWQPGNNTMADASLFINGIEDFAPSSILIIKKWFNYMAVPLGSVVTGNFGNLILNSKSGNVIYEWNQNDQFTIHQILGTLTIEEGWITLDKSTSISNVTIGNIVLSTPNAYLLFHSGSHPSTITINTSSIQNNGGNIWGIYNGNGDLNLNVAGNFTNSGNIKLIYNDGIPNVGTGNVYLNVNQSFIQTAGDFRAIYNVSSPNSGIYEMNFKNIFMSGGIFFGQYGCHTGAKDCKLTVTGSLSLDMNAATDKFRGIGLTSLSGNINNAGFILNVSGTVTISGHNSAEFTTNAAQSLETNTFGGSVTINGCDVNFNHGTAATAHNVIIVVSGGVLVTGGNLNLSRLPGELTATFNHNFALSGGTVSIKRAAGSATVNLNRNFVQSGGILYFKNASSLVSSSPVNVTVTGSFTQTDGLFSFGNDISGTGPSNLNLKGSSVTFAGTGIINRTTNSNFGLINFNRTGTISFTRTGTLHSIDKIKQIINSGTILDVVSGDLQLSNTTTATTDMLHINNGGRLNMRSNQIFSPGLSQTYSGLRVNAGGTLATQNINGLYNTLGTACINNIGNMNFYMDANSTVVYNGTSNQTITGLAASAATINHKYGKLEINQMGLPDINFAALGANVFVRNQLILTNGELNLNYNTLTIENGSTSAIIRTNGYIKSELPLANNTSKVRWRFMTSGNHTFPFGVNSTNYIPVTFNVLAGAGNEVIISTRATGTDNLPLPSSPSAGAVSTLTINDPSDPETKIIDRYWDIRATGITADVIISYRGAENTLDPSYKMGTLATKYWDGSDWLDLNSAGSGVTSGIGTMNISGTNSFGAWIIASNEYNPLPIKLLSFTAKLNGDKVRLNWETASEKNNDFFTIERSSDAINFSEIAIVKGAGDSNSILKYESWDNAPLKGLSYYRLKQTDFDGKYSYTEIVSINISSDANVQLEIQNISPNPFTDNFEIRFSSPATTDIELELFNLKGQRLHREIIPAQSGNNSYTYDKGSELPAGTYITMVKGNGVTSTKKIIKK